MTKVTATDANGDTLTYGISGGADAARFKIDAKTGALAFVTAPNYESPTDSGANNVYNVNVTASDGVNAAVSKALAITVMDVAEGTGGATTNFFSSTAKPAATETHDTTDYELGMRFRATADGEISALRYYRGTADSGDTDVRTLNLWSSSGKKLASVSVTATAGDDGWQVGKLAAPVDIAAGGTYTVSYGTTRNYAFTENYFSSQKTSSDGSLIALKNGGVFNDDGPGRMPTQVWHSSNYWADVVFQADSAAKTMTVALSAESTGAGTTVVGTAAADVLHGTAGDDVLLGGAGKDRLFGEGGADLLKGGGNKDIFVFSALSDSTPTAHDTIADFVRMHDKIDVSAIDAVSGGADDAFTWIGGTAFSGEAGQLHYSMKSGVLTIEGDVDGDGSADLAIGLNGSYHSFFGQDVIL